MFDHICKLWDPMLMESPRSQAPWTVPWKSWKPEGLWDWSTKDFHCFFAGVYLLPRYSLFLCTQAHPHIHVHISILRVVGCICSYGKSSFNFFIRTLPIGLGMAADHMDDVRRYPGLRGICWIVVAQEYPRRSCSLDPTHNCSICKQGFNLLRKLCCQ
jgi:hypothetical protein